MIIKLIKRNYFFFVLFLLVPFCAIYFNSNQNTFYKLREYFNQNSIIIKTNNNLDISKVNVFWNSDFNSGQIIKNGKNTNLIFKEYGPNRFSVLYGKDTIKKFTYSKTNNWHGYKHIISLSRYKDSVKAKFKVIGPDIK